MKTKTKLKTKPFSATAFQQTIDRCVQLGIQYETVQSNPDFIVNFLHAGCVLCTIDGPESKSQFWSVISPDLPARATLSLMIDRCHNMPS